MRHMQKGAGCTLTIATPPTVRSARRQGPGAQPLALWPQLSPSSPPPSAPRSWRSGKSSGSACHGGPGTPPASRATGPRPTPVSPTPYPCAATSDRGPHRLVRAGRDDPAARAPPPHGQATTRSVGRDRAHAGWSLHRGRPPSARASSGNIGHQRPVCNAHHGLTERQAPPHSPASGRRARGEPVHRHLGCERSRQ